MINDCAVVEFVLRDEGTLLYCVSLGDSDHTVPPIISKQS